MLHHLYLDRHIRNKQQGSQVPGKVSGETNAG